MHDDVETMHDEVETQKEVIVCLSTRLGSLEKCLMEIADCCGVPKGVSAVRTDADAFPVISRGALSDRLREHCDYISQMEDLATNVLQETQLARHLVS